MEQFQGKRILVMNGKKLLMAGLAVFGFFSASLNSAIAGHIRKTTYYTPFISSVPTPGTVAFFRSPTAPWRITGGVVLRGGAKFYTQDRADQKAEEVPVAELSLRADKDGIVTISRKQQSYRLDIFPNFVCPLGRFVERGALIAYTELNGVTEEMAQQIATAGLVDSNLISRFDNSIAREFFNTPFEQLFERADHAQVVSLDDATAAPMVLGINKAIGSDLKLSFDRAAYVHADFQVSYKIYLVNSSKEVDTEGVPLRYHLRYSRGSLPYIDRIEVFSQEWPDNATLTHEIDSKTFTQYDVVWAFQMAAIFREFYRSDKVAFAKFLGQACQ
jgi:hypothetical protein